MTEEQENAIVPIEELFPVLTENVTDLAEMIEENLGGEGINRFELEQIKVGAGGTPGYLISQGDEKKMAESFDAIIVHQQSNRSYWEKSFDDGGGDTGVPDCQSDDGVSGSGDIGDGRGKMRRPCETCEKSQWGSDPKGGKGQWCQSRKSVYLYRTEAEGFFPSVLNVPPTSLKAMRDYGTKLLGKGIRISRALHRFTTVTEPRGGRDTTMVRPKFLRRLETGELIKTTSLIESIQGAIGAGKTQQVVDNGVTHQMEKDLDEMPF